MAFNVANLATTLSLNSVGFKNGIGQAQTSITAFQAISLGAFNRIGAGFANLGFRAVTSLSGLVKESFKSADALGKTADRLGISSKALANYHRVAELAGVGTEQFDGFLAKMNVNLVKAAVSGGPLADSLKLAGLDAKALVAAGPDKAFLQLADALKNAEGPMIRASMNAQLFGKQSAQMMSVIDEGSEGIREQAKQTEKLGLAMSRLDIAQIEAANDSFTDLHNVFKGLANTLAVELSPYLDQLAIWLTEFGTSGGRNVNIVTAAFEGMQTAAFTVVGALDNMDLHWKGLIVTIMEAGDAITDFLSRGLHGTQTTGLQAGSYIESLQAVMFDKLGMTDHATSFARQSIRSYEESQKPYTPAGPSAGTQRARDIYNARYDEIQTNSSPRQQALFDSRMAAINRSGDKARGVGIRALELKRNESAQAAIEEAADAARKRKAVKGIEPYEGGFSQILGTAAVYSGSGDAQKQAVDELRKHTITLAEISRRLLDAGKTTG